MMDGFEETMFQRVSLGVSTLKQALANLVMTPAEEEQLRQVLVRNQGLLKELKDKRTDATRKAALQKKLLKEQRQRELDEIHRKSGFTTYLRRAPGSFGG